MQHTSSRERPILNMIPSGGWRRPSIIIGLPQGAVPPFMIARHASEWSRSSTLSRSLSGRSPGFAGWAMSSDLSFLRNAYSTMGHNMRITEGGFNIRSVNESLWRDIHGQRVQSSGMNRGRTMTFFWPWRWHFNQLLQTGGWSTGLKSGPWRCPMKRFSHCQEKKKNKGWEKEKWRTQVERMVAWIFRPVQDISFCWSQVDGWTRWTTVDKAEGRCW